MAQIEYIPGVCNIGREEIARRRNFGWISLAIVIVVFFALVWSGVNSWWRLFIFLPATMSASGFLQAYFHFCSGFARIGAFNFGSVGQRQMIVDDVSRMKDKKKGNQITLYAALIGAVVAVIGVMLV